MKNPTSCIYYDCENCWCTLHTNWSEPMPRVQDCCISTGSCSSYVNREEHRSAQERRYSFKDVERAITFMQDQIHEDNKTIGTVYLREEELNTYLRRMLKTLAEVGGHDN